MMSTTRSSTHAQIATTSSWVQQLGYTIYAEVARTLRIPALLIPGIAFPALFFLLFGIPNKSYTIGAVSVATYLMVSYGAYASMSTSFLSFGISTASERGMGWNKILRASPVNPLFLFIAKFISIIVTVFISLVVLALIAVITAGVHLPGEKWLGLLGALILGMVPFVAMGLTLGYLAGPNSAPGIGNLIFLPLSFLSGILIPIQGLPDFAQKIALYTPSYHVGQLGWHIIGAGDSTAFGIHILWVLGYTALFVLMALFAYRHDEGRTFG